MLDQDDDDLRIVLGAVFGVIALVIGLVIGLGVYKTHHAKPRAAAGAVEEAYSEVEPKGEAIVLLSGFHDETGDAAMNAELAKIRAKSVKQALVAAGVPAEKVLIRKPAVTLGSGSPEEARRVEIRVQ